MAWINFFIHVIKSEFVETFCHTFNLGTTGETVVLRTESGGFMDRPKGFKSNLMTGWGKKLNVIIF